MVIGYLVSESRESLELRLSKLPSVASFDRDFGFDVVSRSD